MHPKIHGISSEEVLAAIKHADPPEAALAQDAFNFVIIGSAVVPTLRHTEIWNTLLVFERAKRLSRQDSSKFPD